jgi:hypothetical protein
MSSGAPNSPTGIDLRMRSRLRSSGSTASPIGVMMMPGCTELQRTL